MNQSNQTKTSNFKKLVPKEIEARWKKNLYFNCDEPYHVGQKCKRLFIIISELEVKEMAELIFEEVVSEGEEYQISVHALAGQVATDTFKEEGKVGKHKLVVLIDRESTQFSRHRDDKKGWMCVGVY